MSLKRKNDGIELSRVMRVRTCSSDFGFNILWLEDRALREIFSHVSVADLGALRNTCRRFSHLVHQVFSEKYWPLSLGSCYTFPKSNLKNEETAQLMEHFGDKFRSVVLRLTGQETKQEVRDYFSLLKYCTSMRELTIEKVDLNLLTIGQMRFGTFKTLTTLNLSTCSGAEANYLVILMACDPDKLERIGLGAGLSDDILAFVAERMHRVQNLIVNLEDKTSAFAENLAKLHNLKKLRSIQMKISFDDVPIASVIDTLSKIHSLDKLCLYCNKTSQNEEIANAINNCERITDIILEMSTAMPNIESITRFRCTHSSIEQNKHYYQYEYRG